VNPLVRFGERLDHRNIGFLWEIPIVGHWFVVPVLPVVQLQGPLVLTSLICPIMLIRFAVPIAKLAVPTDVLTTRPPHDVATSKDVARTRWRLLIVVVVFPRFLEPQLKVNVLPMPSDELIDISRLGRPRTASLPLLRALCSHRHTSYVGYSIRDWYISVSAPILAAP
jgi:hypothetical protein